MSNYQEKSSANDGDKEQIICVVQKHDGTRHDSDEIDLLPVARVIWKRKLWIVAGTALATALAVLYAFMATEWYRAEVVLIARENTSGPRLSPQLAQLGGLASMAGINLGSSNVQEPLGVLKSQGFARRFIEQNNLTDMLNAAFRESQKHGAHSARVTNAVGHFRRSVMTVSDDKKTGLVTIAVQWKDPAITAAWANKLAEQINVEFRSKALAESGRNIRYLRSQLQVTDAVVLQQSIASMIESEMQKVMIAQGANEYAYRVIDRAEPPTKRIKPKRTLVVLVGLMAGLFIFTTFALMVDPLKELVKGLKEN